MKLFLKCKIETPWFGKKSQRRLKVTIECISDGDFVGDSFFFFGNCQWVLSLKEVKKVFHKFHLIGYTLRWFSGSRGSSEYINGPWPRTKNGYENVDVKQCFGRGVHQKSLRPTPRWSYDTTSHWIAQNKQCQIGYQARIHYRISHLSHFLLPQS